MASKKSRQTLDKLRREQAVRKKREDKAQRKADAKAAKALGITEETGFEQVPDVPNEGAETPDAPPPATVETTKNGSGLREAPSTRVHPQ